jgi:hypothetical protein
MGYLSKLMSVVGAVLLWHLYHLNPDVAQLKDVLQLLHSETVHGHVAIGFILLLLLDDGFGARVSYVSHQSAVRCARSDNNFGVSAVKDLKKQD